MPIVGGINNQQYNSNQLINNGQSINPINANLLLNEPKNNIGNLIDLHPSNVPISDDVKHIFNIVLRMNEKMLLIQKDSKIKDVKMMGQLTI